MDGQRVHALVRRAAAHRRRARRPLRPPADVRDRPRASSRPPPPPPRSRPRPSALIAARALQGVGAAIVTPLTLTLLADAFPAEKRGLAIGAWSGISGLGVALGPLVGGAVVEGISWQWIFWLNVPIGLALLPLAARHLTESHGPARSLDLPGLGLASAGLLGIVYGIVRGSELGWTSTTVLASLIAGAVLLAAFLAWELRAPEPMLPLRFFRSRAFAAVNAVSLAMYFGVFGSIFLLAQFFQVTQGYSPLEAGLRTLPWTGDADARRADRRACCRTGSARAR